MDTAFGHCRVKTLPLDPAALPLCVATEGQRCLLLAVLIRWLLAAPMRNATSRLYNDGLYCAARNATAGKTTTCSNNNGAAGTEEWQAGSEQRQVRAGSESRRATQCKGPRLPFALSPRP